MIHKYRLYLEGGTEAGDAHYAILVQPGETISTGDGRKLRVLDLTPVEDDASPYVGLLTVAEAAIV